MLRWKTKNTGTDRKHGRLRRSFDDANPWNVVARYQEEGTNLHVKVEGIVNGGVIAMVEGLRGFIPHPAFLFLISKIWRLIF